MGRGKSMLSTPLLPRDSHSQHVQSANVLVAVAAEQEKRGHYAAREKWFVTPRGAVGDSDRA